jgi:hypothetical protein
MHIRAMWNVACSLLCTIHRTPQLSHKCTTHEPLEHSKPLVWGPRAAWFVLCAVHDHGHIVIATAGKWKKRYGMKRDGWLLPTVQSQNSQELVLVFRYQTAKAASFSFWKSGNPRPVTGSHLNKKREKISPPPPSPPMPFTSNTPIYHTPH